MNEKRSFYTKKSTKPNLVFQPAVHQMMLNGINTVVDAIRITLGPKARTVAITHLLDKEKTPEILSSGGIIAKRIIELSENTENIGGMLARELICKQHDLVGDGSATAAVLFQSIYKDGVRYLSSGGSLTLLRYHIEQALPKMLHALDKMTFHVMGRKKLASVAETICHDPPLAKNLGEIFDIIGAFGQFEIRSHHSRDLRCEYLDGSYWNSGLFSREMIKNPAKLQTVFENAAFLIGDVMIDDPRHIIPILEETMEAKIRRVIIVVSELSEDVIAGLLLANQKLKELQVIAVKLPGVNEAERIEVIEDLAILTGGTPLLQSAGDTIKNFTVKKFGLTRRGWASLQSFGLIGGKGNPKLLSEHISRLKSHFISCENPKQRDKIQQRIGKLLGGSAILWIGGDSETEIEKRKELARLTSFAMRGAVREGVLPGGGVSLLACRRVLELKGQYFNEKLDPDELSAHRILYEALAAPARAIFENAGYNSGEILEKISIGKNKCGFDVLSGQLIDLKTIRIVDSSVVLKMVLRNALMMASVALSIDVLIHHRRPEISRNGQEY